ncbi:MAG: beta-L-arabinofuranosidase domain-containing protein, partial [Bacteroidota bacterium]
MQGFSVAPLPFSEVEITAGMWQDRLETNRKVSIPFAFQKCKESGRIDNFSIAAGQENGDFRGKRYDDSEVYKVLEGAAYTLQTHPDPTLERYLDSLIQLIAAAQEPDGYLFTTRTIKPDQPADASPGRWSDLGRDHELYNAGHLYEAAVAHHQATGKTSFLEIAIKHANLVYEEFVVQERAGVPGHQEIEMGLIRLYTATGEEKYLDLAHLFLERRGRQLPEEKSGINHQRPVYSQQHLPVAQQNEAVGHAVRAGHQYIAMADIAGLKQDSSYRSALQAIWEDVVTGKQSITGGVGASRAGESFAAAYQLPNALAHNETCAAIANMRWNYRMYLLHG